MRSYGGFCVAGIVIRFWKWKNGRPGMLCQSYVVYLVVKPGANLAVPSDEKPTLARVDTVLGKVVDFDFLKFL